ncbi:hypothetical protein BJY01DRAFT_102126 [Aspergillus pseudoustus]|uniref:Uncharacterized protein n=1 Tax=Aspergillus pseudoustus TaxID=1810923 RepID=A0ABR4IWX2_9EURO
MTRITPAPNALIRLDLSFVVIRALRGPCVYIVLIAILLCLGVLWCHALIRFIMAVYQFPYPKSTTDHGIIPISMIEAAGYAKSSQPIHVTMVGDEERLSENHGDVRV